MKGKKNGIAATRSDFFFKQASFDIGVAQELIGWESYAKRSHSSERISKWAWERYLHWAEPCKDIFIRCQDTINKLGIPEYTISASAGFQYTDNSILKRIITEEWGKNVTDFYVLGCLVWEVGKAPRRRGYLEDLKDLSIKLYLPNEVTDIISSWLLCNKENKSPDPKDVNEFINSFRKDLMVHLSQPTPEVFISYSHHDIGLATELVTEFEKRNIRCFLAQRDIPSGDNWTEEIRQSLLSCSEILAIVTPNSKDSAWLMIEAGVAWANKKVINIGFAYVDLKELPPILSGSQAVEIDTIQGRQRLVQEVCNRLEERKYL